MKNKLSFDRNIILIGFMGSGKSRIGKHFARQLRYQFLDTDSLIVSKAGKSIAKIFEEDGEKAFRELESAVLKELTGKEKVVLATGGGTMLCPNNQEIARNLGTVVWINAHADVLFERATRRSTRPLLDVEFPRKTFNELLAKRLPIYEASCHVYVDTSNLSYEQTLKAIVEAMMKV